MVLPTSERRVHSLLHASYVGSGLNVTVARNLQAHRLHTQFVPQGMLVSIKERLFCVCFCFKWRNLLIAIVYSAVEDESRS
jgi:hypothetical protein